MLQTYVALSPTLILINSWKSFCGTVGVTCIVAQRVSIKLITAGFLHTAQTIEVANQGVGHFILPEKVGMAQAPSPLSSYQSL
jgi:hypothetical protein